MKPDLRALDFEKIDRKYGLYLQLGRPDVTCRWLDTLLGDHNIKQRFSIPGSKNGNQAKIKIIMEL